MYHAPLVVHEELGRDRHRLLLHEARRAQANRNRVAALRPMLAISVVVLSIVVAALLAGVLAP